MKKFHKLLQKIGTENARKVLIAEAVSDYVVIEQIITMEEFEISCKLIQDATTNSGDCDYKKIAKKLNMLVNSGKTIRSLQYQDLM